MQRTGNIQRTSICKTNKDIIINKVNSSLEMLKTEGTKR